MSFKDEANQIYKKAVEVYAESDNGHDSQGRPNVNPKIGPEHILNRFAWVKDVFNVLEDQSKIAHWQAEQVVTNYTEIGGLGDAIFKEVQAGNTLDAARYIDKQGSESLATAPIPNISGLEGWEGDTADAFRTFYSMVPAVRANQVSVARFLNATMRFNIRLRASIREDVSTITKATLSALDWHNRGRPGKGASAAELSSTFFIVAAVATILSGGLAAGLAAGVGTAVIGGISLAGSIAGDAANAAKQKDEKHKKFYIRGFNVDSILSSMKDAVDSIPPGVAEAEQGMARMLNSLSDDMDKDAKGSRYGTAFKYRAPRPYDITANPATAYQDLIPPAPHRR